MSTKLTLMVLLIFLYCCFKGSPCGAFGLDPTSYYLLLGEFSGLQKAYQRHHVDNVEIDRSNSNTGALGGLDIPFQILGGDLETQIHEMPTFVASAGEPLAEKGEHAGYSGADSTADQSSGRRINLHDFFSVVGWALLGAGFVLVPQAALFFLMWWLDMYRPPFGRGPSV